MEKPQPLSAAERGEMYAQKLRSYLAGLKESGQPLPMDGSKPNVTALSEASGVPRNSFYTNKGVKRVLKEFTGCPHEEGSEDGGGASAIQRQVEALQRRVLQLEQQAVALRAEKEDLRRQLAEANRKLIRYRVIEEEVIKSGRRISL